VGASLSGIQTHWDAWKWLLLALRRLVPGLSEPILTPEGSSPPPPSFLREVADSFSVEKSLHEQQSKNCSEQKLTIGLDIRPLRDVCCQQHQHN